MIFYKILIRTEFGILKGGLYKKMHGPRVKEQKSHSILRNIASI